MTDRSRLTYVLTAVAALGWGWSEAVKTASAASPNVVVIVADDMNWDDCGAYGHPAIRTPHIDELAASGLLFRNAFLTTSSCSPSRASILTGLYPHSTGAEQLHWPLPAGSRTLAQALHENGYHTAAAGKWHLGDNVRPHFDRIYEASTSGFVLPTGDGESGPTMIAERPSGCEDWVRAIDDCPVDKPFFLWLAALDPHREYSDGALDPPHALADVIVPPHLPDTPDVREDLRLYYDEIGRLDEYVGRVSDALAEKGVDRNTLVLFISDNGRPFPRDKTTLYDGGIRTPWIVRWPAAVGAGLTTDALVSSVDIAATILDIAGIDEDAGADDGHGLSFRHVLNAPTAAHRSHAFAEDHWHDYEDHARAIISPQYKLIRNDYRDLPSTPSADAGRGLAWQNMLELEAAGRLTAAQRACFDEPRPAWELYDRLRDPHELRNVADDPAYAAVFESLRDELAAWAERTGDYLPTTRTPDEFDRTTGEPDHSVRVRPRRSKLEMFGTNGAY
ncbi:MAG: sulfatase [Planctomycetota bacterium]